MFFASVCVCAIGIITIANNDYEQKVFSDLCRILLQWHLMYLLGFFGCVSYIVYNLITFLVVVRNTLGILQHGTVCQMSDVHFS